MTTASFFFSRLFVIFCCRCRFLSLFSILRFLGVSSSLLSSDYIFSIRRFLLFFFYMYSIDLVARQLMAAFCLQRCDAYKSQDINEILLIYRFCQVDIIPLASGRYSSPPSIAETLHVQHPALELNQRI